MGNHCDVTTCVKCGKSECSRCSGCDRGPSAEVAALARNGLVRYSEPTRLDAKDGEYACDAPCGGRMI